MIESRQELAEFCLRALGAGVINIEVSDDQLEDCVDMAVEYYREFHYDGIERDFIRAIVTETTLSVADTSTLVVGDIITGSTTGAISKVTSIVNTTDFTVARVQNLKMFKFNETFTVNSVVYTITKVVEGSIDSNYFEIEDSVVGVLKVLNINSILSTSNYLFDPKFQLMQTQLRNIGTANMQYYVGAMHYLADMEFVLKKEKTFRFNRRQNKIHLDIDWDLDVKPNDILVFEVYRYVDDDLYGEMLNDRWLRLYTTALLKRQWANNTKKYEGMQLPGGMRFTGQQMYMEAMQEIAMLEQEMRDCEEPLLFVVG
jgi:hypothetical protein